MKANFSSAMAGFVFALGLGISGMTNPAKVVAFLNVTGAWDPSLMFVMAGAIGVHFVLYRLIRRRPHPLFSEKWHLPHLTRIDRSLAAGSAMFGVGWGLAGYCPGPAVTSLASLQVDAIGFVGAMFAGMLLFRILAHRFSFRLR